MKLLVCGSRTVTDKAWVFGLAHDDEVELHPYDTRVFTVKVRERSDQPKTLIEPNTIVGAIGDYCNVRTGYIIVEEVK